MVYDWKSAEDCLAEAAECERLARLARSDTTRVMMKLAAIAWREQAREIADLQLPVRKKRHLNGNYH